MRKKYLVEIRVREVEKDRMIVDFCEYRDSLLECATDTITARGKIEMSHLFDLMSESMNATILRLIDKEERKTNEIIGKKSKGESA